ncbi:MAG: hypothetical protein QNJ64_16385 [Crocosphaera sp.]|nr:hypothetical protein [Crocosphaera sp.]
MPVLANEEPKHPYPVNPLDRSRRKDEFKKYQGYNNRDYLMAALGYYSSIVEAKTPKGYFYCACNPKFTVKFNPAYESSGSPAHGIGFYYNWQSFDDGNGNCVKKNFDLFTQLPSAIQSIEKRVRKRNSNPDTIHPYEDLSVNNPRVFNGGISFAISYQRMIEFGCHLPPENDCPKLVIRAIPIIRTTVTCNKKNSRLFNYD